MTQPAVATRPYDARLDHLPADPATSTTSAHRSNRSLEMQLLQESLSRAHCQEAPEDARRELMLRRRVATARAHRRKEEAALRGRMLMLSVLR